MNPISCLLIDDEDLALDVLECYIARLEGFYVAGRCNNTLEADLVIQNNRIDLVFLDIQMPMLNGMEWIKRIENKPAVIFCTAFEQFALESYEVNAIDYLLKPFSFERFEKSVLKAKAQIETARAAQPQVHYLNIRSERKTHRIAIDTILYFQSLSNYYIVVTQEKKYIAYGSLAILEKELPAQIFLRIHKSYIVAVAKVKAMSGSVVVLQNQQLPVGKKYRAAVKAVFE